MSNMDNILKTIIDKAEKEAAEIKAQAQNQADQEYERALESAEKEAQTLVQRAENERELIADTVKSGLERESRDKVLQAREDVVDEVFQTAKSRLKNLSDEEYSQIIDRYLANHDLDQDLVIVIPENRNYESKQGYQVEKSKTLESGFRIESEEIRISYDFAQIVEVLRESLEPEIGKMISER